MAISLPRRSFLPLAVLVAAAATSLAGDSPARAGGGCHGTSVLSGTGTEVSMRAACFEPVVLYVKAGDTVTFTNTDSFDHLVTGAANGWASADFVRAGQTVSFSFDTPGVYPYSCHLHPAMTGAIVVGDGAAAATTGGVQPIAARVQPPGTDTPQSVEAAQSNGGSSGIERWQMAAIAAAALAVGVAAALGGGRIRGRA